MSNEQEYEDEGIYDESEEPLNEEESEEDGSESEEEGEEGADVEPEEEGEPESTEANEADEGDEYVAEEKPRGTITKELKRTKREELRAKAQVEDLQAELQRQQAFSQHVWQESQRAMQENEAQRQYAQSLNSRVQDTSQAYMEQHDEMLNIRLSQAEKMKREAIESGNVDAMMDADRAFNSVMFEMGEQQKWKVQEDIRRKNASEEAEQQNAVYRQQVEQQQAIQYHQQVAHQQEANELNGWLQTNQWADPRSQEYDQELVNTMDGFADNYEAQLRNSGYGHMVGSLAFKQKISEFAQQYRNGKQPRGNLNMRTPKYPVNASRGSGGRAPEPRRSQVTLTRDEVDVVDRLRAAGHNVTKESYAASKERDIRMNPEGRKTGRSSLSLNIGR